MDVDALTKEVIKNNLKTAGFPEDVSEEQLDAMATQICEDGQSYLYQSAQSKLTQLAGSMITMPIMATSLVSQFATIPASVTGMAAPAAAPMVLGVKSQLISTLSTAAELGINLPVDPLLAIIPLIKPLL